MVEKTLDQKLEFLKIEKIKPIIKEAMSNARYVTPYTDMAGIVRNDIVKTVVNYLNTLQEEYKFQDNYKVEYKKQ